MTHVGDVMCFFGSVVKAFDQALVLFGDDMSLEFESGSQLAPTDGKVLGHEGELLDFLRVGNGLFVGLGDAGLHGLGEGLLVRAGIVNQVLDVDCVGDVGLLCQPLQGRHGQLAGRGLGLRLHFCFQGQQAAQKLALVT